MVKFKKTITYLILGIGVMVSGCAMLLGYSTAAKGFALGSLFSLLNFLVMYRQTPGNLGRERKAATVHSGFSIILRMGLLAIAMYIASIMPEVSMIWTAAGIFNLQISIMLYGFVLERYGLTGEPFVEGR